MRRRNKDADFPLECQAELDAIRGMLNQQVPLSAWYVAGTHPTLVAIENGLCTLRFANGAVLYNVPLRDLADNLSYWNICRKEL